MAKVYCYLDDDEIIRVSADHGFADSLREVSQCCVIVMDLEDVTEAFIRQLASEHPEKLHVS